MIFNTTSHIVFENKKSALKKIRMHKHNTSIIHYKTYIGIRFRDVFNRIISNCKKGLYISKHICLAFVNYYIGENHGIIFGPHSRKKY